MRYCLYKYSLFLLLLFIYDISFAQSQISAKPIVSRITPGNSDLFNTQTGYIENIGQYGEILPGYSYMGKVLYGYEGLGMPVLFTNKGIIHLHRQTKIPSREEIEKEEGRKKRKGEGNKKWETISKTITMEWLNANPNPQIISEDEMQSYHTYGLFAKKARAFKKLIYKNLYPGIDVVFSFTSMNKPGFEYTLLVKPGADVKAVKMKYGGDIKKIEKNKEGYLFIRSAIDGIMQSDMLAYYGENDNSDNKISVSFLTDKNVIRFKLPVNYNKEKGLVIDPFVSSTNTLTGLNDSKAKDIDFDYAGNIYVSGGGDNSFQRLAKFNAAGVLQWTFSGSLAAQGWNFGSSYGGWVVEKTSGTIYLGQGLAGGGFSVIRLTTGGLFDNYITTSNSNFGENWKMLYSCRGGIGTLLIAGGGGSANNELALLSPPSLIPATSNISGLTGGHNDISDIIIDPFSDDMYTIFSTSVLAPGTDNIIYKHMPPHSAANLAWSVPTKFFALREPNNRPYMQGLDNSSNTLAVNSGYLFYWDGKNLQAFSKATGATVGNPLNNSSGVLLQQGGIYADECNNIFVGSGNGTIRVLQFNGTTFDDTPTDLIIAGFPNNSVYDLAYDNGKQLLYASGDGFVASFDISSYCPSTIYAVPVLVDCSTLSASASINPTPPAGTTISYVLYDGATTVANNATGRFSGLVKGTNYTIKAFLNQACGGTQATGNFTITSPPVLLSNPPPTICLPYTSDLTAATITSGSSPGLTFSYWQDAAATIPYTTPAAATAGTYYIKGTAISGCAEIEPVIVNVFPSPIANAGSDTTICFGTDIQLKGSGGTAFTWNPSTYLSNPNIPNPIVSKAKAGTFIYHLKVTDNNGCQSLIDEQVAITITTPATVFIGRDTVLAINQPLQLNAIDVNASGFTSYSWSPAYGLSNANIPNPVSVLDRDITYVLKAITASNCEGSAAIHIKVYKGPEIYVPTAFTPGKDGLNDILRAIPVGIKEFLYFSIYNRWGQLVFTTTDPRKGWDGKIQGKEQGSGGFVWMAKAIDFSGNVIFRKGTCTLIR